ncbi:MAG: hypothetical protein HOP37_10010 [Cyclobacteriaceae bacterium]|nr:hypothetical protein [Cyclobacteriaceae bacterium]
MQRLAFFISIILLFSATINANAQSNGLGKRHEPRDHPKQKSVLSEGSKTPLVFYFERYERWESIDNLNFKRKKFKKKLQIVCLPDSKRIFFHLNDGRWDLTFRSYFEVGEDEMENLLNTFDQNEPPVYSALHLAESGYFVEFYLFHKNKGAQVYMHCTGVDGKSFVIYGSMKF